MSLDPQNYISTSEAAKLYSYHPAYLAKLCKNEKLDAKLLGGSWMIRQESLENFIAKRAAEKHAAAEHLSAARKNEYQKKSNQTPEAASGAAVPVLEEVLPEESVPSSFLHPFPHTVFTVALVAGAVLFSSALFATSSREHTASLTAAPVTAQSGALLHSGETTALFTYDTINSLFEKGTNILARLFKPNSVVLYNTPQSTQVTTATTTKQSVVIAPNYFTTRAPVSNYFFQGVTPAYVDTRFAELLAKYIDAQARIVSEGNSSSGGGGSGDGSVTSVGISGGSTGLSFSGGPITDTGTFILDGILAIANGGTATSTAPTYGQLLVGDGNGGYQFLATSSLGINAGAAAAGGSNTQVQFNDAGTLNGNAAFTFNQAAGRLTITNASSTNFSSTYASSTNAFFGNLSVGNLSGALRAAGGVISTGLVALGSEVSGILGVSNGGTGWAAIQSGAIPYGNGSSALSTTTAGTNGQVLALVNGVPTWTATTTLATISGTLALGSQVSGTLSVGNGGTGQTSFTSGNLLYGAGSGAVQNVATTSFATSGEFSYSGTLGALVGGANGTLSLTTNGVALTKLAQVAANTILGNNTGAAGNVVAFATSTLGIALSDTVGTLAANRGGTGFSSYTPGDILYANSATTFAKVASSTNGFVLALANGAPTWVASTTLATISGTLNLASQVSGILPATNGGTGWGALQANTLLLGNGTGAVATTSAGTNGQVLALVNGVPTWQATTTLSTISGTLAIANGGTGITTTPNYGELLVGNGSGGYTLLATSSLGITGGGSGTPGGSDTQVQFNDAGSFGGNAAFTFNKTAGRLTITNASSTNFSSTYASSTNAFFGNLSVGNLTGVLRAASGVVSTGLVALGSEVSGILGVSNGGTGWAAIQSGAIPYGNGSSALSTTTAGTNGQVLALVSGIPTWVATTTLATISGTLNLATQITGTLGVGNGGTGQTSFAQGWLGINDSGAFISSTSPTVAYITATSTTATSTFARVALSGPLSLFGTYGTSLADFCTAITGGSGLCDGTDNVSGGGSGLATSTDIADNQVIYGTSANDVGAEAAFTYNHVSDRLTVPYASTTALSTSYASSTNAFFGNLSVGTLNGPLQANNGVVSATSSVGVLYGGTGLTSLANGALTYGSGGNTLSTLAASTNGFVLALANGVPAWVASTTLATISGTLNLASQVSGVLGVSNGGTGWAAIQSGAIPYGNGSSALSTTTAGTNGQVLALVGGVPTWQATTTLSTISGTLAANQGGTGISSYTPGDILYANSATTFAKVASSTNGFILALANGAPSWVASTTLATISGTLNLASQVSGILTVPNGGTGWANIQANSIVLGNGAGAVATTSAGTNGQVLALVSGVPTWVATTSINNGVSSIQQTGGGTAQTGAITFATSSQTTNGQTVGLNITNTSGAFTFAPTLSGTLTGAGGGTGFSSYTPGDILYANTANTFAKVSSSTNGFILALANGAPAWVASTTLATISGTLNLASQVSGILAVPNGGTGWAAIQSGAIPYGNGSSALSTTTAGTNGFTLALVSGVPTWVATTTLSTISGTLAASQGGTGISSYTPGDILYANSATTFAKVASSTNGFILALANGAPSWVASTTLATISGTLNLASQVSGILPTANGGTGWAAIQANSIVLGNGSGAVATTSAGTNGQVLALVSGVPTWVATTTINNGVSSIQQTGGGTAQTGAITFATSSATSNGITSGLNITNSSGAFTFTPTLSGTLTGAGGGTGFSSYTPGDILYANTATTFAKVASSTNGFILALANGAPSWVASTTLATISGTLNLASQVSGILTVPNGGTGWAAIQSGAIPYGNGTGALSTTTAGTDGFTLALVSGVPTWVATTTLSTISGTLAVGKGGTGATSFTSGSVIYSNGTILTQDNSNFFWSSLNHFLGLGTNSPQNRLDVNGGVAIGSYAGTNAAPSNSLIVSGNVGIGTTSPYAVLSVVGPEGVVADKYYATSTTATSTFAGGLNVGSGALTYDFTSGITSITNAAIGAMTFDTDSGAISWVDMPVTSSASAGTAESYSAQLDGSPVLTVFGVSDGAGGVASTSVGIGTSTPWGMFSINPTAALGTAPQFVIGSSTGGTSFIVNNKNDVGIGTTSPYAQLSIHAHAGQDSFAVGSSTNTWLKVTSLGTTSISKLDVTGTATSSFSKGINLATGCFAINNTCVGTSASSITSGTLAVANGGTGVSTLTQNQFTFYNGTGFTTASTTAINNSAGYLGLGTSTPQWLLNLASSTRPQLTLSDGSATASPFNFRAINSLLYISTSSPTTFATTTSSVFSLDSSTGSTTVQKLFVSGTATSTISGNLSFPSITPKSSALFIDSAGALITSAASSFLSTSLTDETGTGVAVFGTSPTFTTSIAAAPIVYGGSAVGSTLTLRSTSGAGVGADAIIFGTGNNGANENGRMTLAGFGLGTTTPRTTLTVSSSTAPQLTLTDASATASPFNFRAINNKFYISTSSPTTFATTTPSILAFDNTTGSTTLLKIDVSGTATSSFGAGINLATGCFSINNTCVGSSSVVPGGTGTELQYRSGASTFGALANSAYITQGTGNGYLGLGTTTPHNTLTLASSTQSQLGLADGSLTSDQWNLRSISGSFFLATSSPSTFSTSTIAAFSITPTGTSIAGTVNLTGLTADRLVVSTTGGALTNTISSANLALSVSDETGTGSLVFSASPSLTGIVTITSTGVTTFGGDSGRAIEIKANSAGIAQYFDWADLTAEDYDFRFINNSASNNFQIVSSSTANILTLAGGGNVGVGTSTPWRLLSVAGAVANPQFVIGYDNTRYAQLQTNSVGDLILSSYSSAIYAGTDNNLYVCAGGACPAGGPSGTGNIIAETAIGIGTSTPWAGLSIGTGNGSSTKAIVVAEHQMATSTSMTIDWRNGNQQLVRMGTAATSIAFTGFIDGQKLVLTVCNPGATAGALSFTTQVLWPGGTAPSQTTTANKCDVWSFLATQATSTLKIFGSQTANF